MMSTLTVSMCLGSASSRAPEGGGIVYKNRWDDGHNNFQYSIANNQ